ncbi:hypothetical protein [Streptomyces coryli]|uniref:hypothetical protein n=1 Tax=Streptomyces coryli TaxID=1128680 RepID=UPI0019D29137|nr:hypothetical protein [Streptomyces coryli]
MGLTLSACGGDEEPSSASSPSESEASAPKDESSAPEDKASEDGAAEAGNVKTTAPGTKLKVGETATVPFKVGDKKGTISITVTAIDKGTSADLKAGGANNADKIDAYYVKSKIENAGGTDLSFSSVSGLRVFAANGGPTGAVLSGEIPGKCESESAPDDFASKGASYESCDLSGAAKGNAIGGVEYEGSTGLEPNPYEDKAITWVK